MNKEFIKVRTVKDIIIASILIVLGLVLLILPTPLSVNIVGSLLLVLGLVLLVMQKTGWQDSETKELYYKRQRFFCGNSKAKIIDALEHNPESIDLSDEGKGEGLLMDIYYGKRSGKAFVRLFEYIPYKYEPVSSFFEYPIDKIKKLIGNS